MSVIAEIAGEECSEDLTRTFVFVDGGNTLGSALKAIICRYPGVVFCGYTIPHPTENKLHFRIQSSKVRAIDILKQGFEDLEKLCEYTVQIFKSEAENFNT